VHVHFLDPYRSRSSLYHRLDARVKLVFSLAFILTSALIPHGAWPAYILLFTVAIIVELLSDLGVGYVLKRSVLALPFVLAALPVIFTYQHGDVVFTISIGSWTLQAYSGGVERFISVALKSWLSLQVAIVLAASTPFPDLLRAMRAIHIPRLIVAIFGLMWRYLFVLVDEAMRLMRARASRSSHSDQAGLKTGGSIAWRGRVTGGMAGSLFLRGIERSDRIYMAMLARGYDGEIRTFPLPQLSSLDRIFLVAGLSFLGLLLVLSFLL
jgi:cobalt/nickel transport system permease protein